MANSRICVIDYKLGGNIFNVLSALKLIGAEAYTSSKASEIEAAEKIIFPGVGSFSQSMNEIKKLGLNQVIASKACSGIPFLGICVGMQVMFEKGTESEAESSDGLGLFKGIVDKFPENLKLKIPHMGWNQVQQGPQNPLFEGIDNNENFYFVHSYKASMDNKLKNPQAQFASSSYGQDFISHIWNGKNLFAVQFHPEKSGQAGLKLLSNFLRL